MFPSGTDQEKAATVLFPWCVITESWLLILPRVIIPASVIKNSFPDIQMLLLIRLAIGTHPDTRTQTSSHVPTITISMKLNIAQSPRPLHLATSIGLALSSVRPSVFASSFFSVSCRIPRSDRWHTDPAQRLFLGELFEINKLINESMTLDTMLSRCCCRL